MKAERAVRGLLILAVTLLATLGHASPPDPTWLAGVWDGADYDDVVLIATSGDAADDGGRLDLSSPRWVVLGTVGAGGVCAQRAADGTIVRGRAPPIA